MLIYRISLVYLCFFTSSSYDFTIDSLTRDVLISFSSSFNLELFMLFFCCSCCSFSLITLSFYLIISFFASTYLLRSFILDSMFLILYSSFLALYLRVSVYFCDF
jgi:hypothetical protein